jgi:hypothetical protein
MSVAHLESKNFIITAFEINRTNINLFPYSFAAQIFAQWGGRIVVQVIAPDFSITRQ